jgi:hypothetical protein
MNTTTEQPQNQTTNQQNSSKNPEISTQEPSVIKSATESKTTRKNHDNNQQINYHAHQCTMVRWGVSAACGGRERPNHPTIHSSSVDLVTGAVGAVGGWAWWC